MAISAENMKNVGRVFEIDAMGLFYLAQAGFVIKRPIS